MTGFLLGLVFAGGLALLWLGLACDVQLPPSPGGLRERLASAGVDAHPAVFGLAELTAALVAGLVVWSLVRVPILALVAAAGGA